MKSSSENYLQLIKELCIHDEVKVHSGMKDYEVLLNISS